MTIPARIMEDLHALPTIPKAALELNRVLSRGDASPSDVAGVVRPDPALTANLLKVVNSASMGLRRKITTVDQAASMLGQRGVLRVASMALLGQTLPTFLPGYGVPTAELWRHCAAVAVLSEQIAVLGGDVEKEIAFTAGLLHDVGKLAVGAALEDVRDAMVDQLQQEGSDLFREERSVLGTDHAEVGQVLAEHWALPEAIASAVAHHHSPDQAPPEHVGVAQIVHVADGLAHALGFGVDIGELHRQIRVDVLDARGLGETELNEVIGNSVEAILEFCEEQPGRA